MAFYRPDQRMTVHLEELIDRFAKEGRPSLKNSLALTWIRYNEPNPEAGSGLGANWSESRLLYPASVVKLVYAIAIEAWLLKDILPESQEIRKALQEMIKNSSNDATSLIVDLLTGTTSGPSLQGEHWKTWQKQRNIINTWLKHFKWKELDEINCCQKTWEDSPYGRERDFYGSGNNNRNALSTAAIGRLLEGVMTESIISPRACKNLKELLARSTNFLQRSQDPNNQVDGFLGEGLPKGTRLWSKAGWMSQVRHDAAWFCLPEEKPMLLVVFTQGHQLSNDKFLLPAIANELAHFQS